MSGSLQHPGARNGRRRSFNPWPMWVRVVAAIVGGGIVFALFTVAGGDDPNTTVLLKLEQYTLWRLLIAGVTALGIAVAPSIWALYNELRELHQKVADQAHSTSRVEARLWAGFVLLVVGITLGQLFSTRLDPIAGWPGRSAALFASVLLIVAPALVGLWLATATIVRQRQAIKAIGSPPEGQLLWGEQQVQTVERLTQLRTLLQRLLAALSVAVSAVTLSTGMLRMALLAGPDPPSYPAAGPLLLGLFFSILVSLSYLPAAVNLQDTLGEFANKVSPIPTKELSETWSENRERVEKLLPTGDATKDSVQTSIAILAPLLTSLTAVLFK